MSEPTVPTIDELGDRPFAFYPPIRNIAQNEWRIRETKWSEVLVSNCRSGQEIWIPRRFIGEVASVEDPITIVGLTRELEYKAGAVWPYERRILKMPKGGPSFSEQTQKGPEVKPPSLVSRLKTDPEMKVGRLIAAALAVVAVVMLVALGITFRPVKYKGVEQVELALSGEDDYHAVVRALGPPSEDRWRNATGEMQYRLLRYKDRGFTIILMGAERETARYIGAINDQGKPVHSVRLPGGGDTAPLLRRLAQP